MIVLPDGVPTDGSLAQASNGSSAISAEGSDILFTSGGALYDRIDGERTVQVDESQRHGSSGGGVFQTMSADDLWRRAGRADRRAHRQRVGQYQYARIH